MRDSTAVQLFVCAVAAVYLFAVCALLRVLLRRLGFPGPQTRAGRLAERAERGSLVLAAVSPACFAYGYFVEPYRPRVSPRRPAIEKTDAAV